MKNYITQKNLQNINTLCFGISNHQIEIWDHKNLNFILNSQISLNMFILKLVQAKLDYA